MPEIASLFNLNADKATQFPVSGSSNAVANSNGFAPQLASAMGKGGDAPSNSTGGKNIPLRMVANTQGAKPEETIEPEINTDAASENITPLLLSAPIIFSDPIQLDTAIQEAPAESTQPIQVTEATTPRVTMASAPVQPAPQTAPAVNPDTFIPLSSRPMGISQTAEDYIVGLATSKPEMGSEAIVLPNSASVAQPKAQQVQPTNSPFVPQAASNAMPVRLQFSEPIVLATPEAGGLRAVTPAEEPMYLRSLIPSNRAAVTNQEEAEAVPVQNIPAQDMPIEEPEAAPANVTSEAASGTEDLENLWAGFKVIANDVKSAFAGKGLEGIAMRAEPLKVANTFHQPLQMTATVGKPMTESAKQGYTLREVAAQATTATPQAETIQAQAATTQVTIPQAATQATLAANAKPSQAAEPNQQAPLETAKPVVTQPTGEAVESTQKSIELNPQPQVEIKKIQPEQFEQRTMDYMKRSIAADTLVSNNGTAGKEGQTSQNQQDKPDSQAYQNSAPNATAAKPTEAIAPASNNTAQQSELASNNLANNLANATERTTLANAPKKQETEAMQAEKQPVERAFQLPEQTEQPKQAKAEERVLRWESAKDAVNLAKLVQQAGQNGVSKLTVRLAPENLGKLEIQLTEIGGRIDAKIVANSTESRALLASNGEAIRQQLADKGIQINNMDFSFHDSLTRQDQNDHGRGAGQEAKQGRFNIAKGDSKADFEQALATEQAEGQNVNALYA